MVVAGGVTAIFCMPLWPDMPLAVTRSICVTASLYLFFMLGMLGAGDVKLCAVAVLYLNGRESIRFLAAGFLVAALISVGKMFVCRNVRERTLYFFSYIAEILRTGKMGLYFKEELALVEKKAVMHMAGPMLLGLVICKWLSQTGGV